MTKRSTIRVFVCVFLGTVLWRDAASAQVAKARADSKQAVAPATVHADRDAGEVGETPLDTPGLPDPTDISVEGSPIGGKGSGAWIRANTPLSVRLNDSASSGVQRNGDTVTGVLLEPVKAANGSVLKPGTPVKATVLSAAKAGVVQSAGVLSLQLFQVGKLPVISNVMEFSGQEGKREIADANPDKGTEAVVQAGTALHFQVLGSGDTPDDAPRARSGNAGPGNNRSGTVSVGQGSVVGPGGFARPAPASTPTTAIHGTTTPH